MTADDAALIDGGGSDRVTCGLPRPRPLPAPVVAMIAVSKRRDLVLNDASEVCFSSLKLTFTLTGNFVLFPVLGLIGLIG